MKKRFLIPLLLVSLLFVSSFEIRDEFQPEPLAVGEQAPLFAAKNQLGDSVVLEQLLKQGPVVLIFYRGAWCSYCNREMRDLQDSAALITAKGAVVVAVTPETDSSIKITIDKTQAEFSIIHDADYRIMKAYKTAFVVDSATRFKYKLWGIDVEAANGNNDFVLPVPATYVIGKDGRITYSFFNRDYKKRATVRDILQAL